MTSGDNAVDTSRLELLLREHFAQTDRQIAEMKANNAEFYALILKEFHDFSEKQEAKFEAFAEKQEAKFDAFTEKVDKKLEAVDRRFDAIDKKFETVQLQITDLQIATEGLRHDVAGLYHWNYWLLSLIVALITMPHILEGIKQLTKSIVSAVSGICSIFRKKDKLPH